MVRRRLPRSAAELEGADLRGPRGVHRCQSHEYAGVRGGGRLDSPADLGGQEGLEDRPPGPADLQAGGRVAEDDAVLLPRGAKPNPCLHLFSQTAQRSLETIWLHDP
jgi:hypothetical protein